MIISEDSTLPEASSASTQTSCPSDHELGVQLDFATVYDETFAFVWRTLRRLGIAESALDDAAQDVYLVVHRRLADFRGESSLKTWIFGIVLRVASTHRRTALRRPTEPLPAREPVSSARSPADEAVASQARATLYRFLDSLDEDKRMAFVMVEIEGMTCPEVSEASGVNLNTVYSRLRAARQEFDATIARYHARKAGGWR